VLCVVDNAQWLDQASAEVLGFVARRLLADRVGMLFAVQDGQEPAAVFDGLPELPVRGLAEVAAQELLAAAAGGPVDSRVSGAADRSTAIRGTTGAAVPVPGASTACRRSDTVARAGRRSAG